MPEQTIVDIDELLPPPPQLRIDGEVYNLPADILIPDLIEVERLVKAADAGEPGSVEALYRKVSEIFAEHNVLEEDEDGPILPIGPRRLGAIVVRFFLNPPSAEEGDEPKPRPRKRAAGTRNTSKPRAKPSKSRSST